MGRLQVHKRAACMVAEAARRCKLVRRVEKKPGMPERISFTTYPPSAILHLIHGGGWDSLLPGPVAMDSKLGLEVVGMMDKQSRPRRAALTLLELLVVIAIIAVLIGP